MEKISAEDIISSLFILGFEKIDILLYICTLAEISLNQKASEWAKIIFDEYGLDFKKDILYIEMSKKGFNINVEANKIEKIYIKLEHGGDKI